MNIYKAISEMIEEDLLLAWGATYKFLDSEELLFKEGTACQFYYQVVKGQVRWVNISEDGKEYLQTIIDEGQCLGELPLFDDGPYAATAIGNCKTTVLRLQKEQFHHLISEHPEIHFKFSRLLTQRLRFKFFMLKEMAYNEPEKLVISLLNYFKEKNQFIHQPFNQVMLTRQEIANFTGLRVETVIRVIRNLHEHGILHIEKGKVYFKDMTAVIKKQ